MSMSGPPVLDPLIPSDQSLTANWTNNPYKGINNASLLIVNKLTNAMNYIFLTEEEALLETYTISNLNNGDTYFVRYTQVQGVPDGEPFSSETRQGIPCSVPDAPILNSIVVLNVNAGTANASVTFGSANGCNIDKLVFQLLNENLGQISSQTFPFVTPTPFPVAGETQTFLLTGLAQNATYVVSCQCINDAGYSNLSNSVEFVQSTAPAAVNVLEVISGLNANLNVTVQGTFNNFVAITKIYLQACASPVALNSVWVTLGYTTVSPWPVDGIFTVDVTSLSGYPAGSISNGTAYNIRAYAQNANTIDGLTGNENKSGVPAKKPVLSSPVLVVDVGVGGAQGTLTATWATNSPTFGPELVQSKFYGPGRVLLGTVVTSGIPAVLSQSGLVYGDVYEVEIFSTVTVPPSTAAYWQTPPLPPQNKIPSPPVEASNVASTKPGAIPYTSISYITGVSGTTANNGVIQFFWQQPDDGYSPITNYVAKLYTVYPTTVSALFDEQDTGIVENTTFTGLIPNTQQYWVTLMAQNTNGDGPISVYPLDQSGIFIVGSIAPVTNIAASQSGLSGSNILIDLTWNAPTQVGYTLNSFTVYSISSTGVQTVIGTKAYVTGTANYTFQTSVSAQPNTYLFGVITTATQTPGSQVVTSVMQTVSIITSGIPVISNVSFSSSINGNGIVNFKIDKSGSNIIANGLMIFCPPAATASGDPNPVNVTPLTDTLINNINTATTMPYTASFALLYPIPLLNTPYLISASNGSGSAYATANLQ